ncbi:hypothetical protein [Asticcacaulis sp. 201]|nr:hypothetical protein [Asticcacaulis sp. 201]MDV6329860.1 hypothetical protein [Asticcacaulis sp. 201]
MSVITSYNVQHKFTADLTDDYLDEAGLLQDRPVRFHEADFDPNSARLY